MDNLNDLKKIWLTADTSSLPNSNEIMQMSKGFRNRKLVKKATLIVCAFISMAMMVAVMFFYRSTMITTRLGEVCIIISGGILLYTNSRSIGRFYHYKDHNNKEFIKFLEQTKLNQIYYHQKTQVAGLAFSSVGLLLYFFENLHQNLLFGIICYAVAVIFILVTWLVIRPRSFKKQTAKMNETMQKLKSLSDQF